MQMEEHPPLESVSGVWRHIFVEFFQAAFFLGGGVASTRDSLNYSLCTMTAAFICAVSASFAAALILPSVLLCWLLFLWLSFVLLLLHSRSFIAFCCNLIACCMFMTWIPHGVQVINK